MTEGDGAVKLLYDMMIQACKDALAGDEEARAWVATTGALIAERFHITTAERVLNWAEAPCPPRTVSVGEAARAVGTRPVNLQKAIRDGAVAAHPYLVRPNHARVYESDVRVWYEWREALGQGYWSSVTGT